MDFLRSCNYTKARLLKDSQETTLLRWYRAPVGARVFRGRHAFGHPAWETDRDYFPGPGCFYAGLEWAPNAYADGPGQAVTGKLDWFAHGLPEAPTEFPETICGSEAWITFGGPCFCGSGWKPFSFRSSSVRGFGRPMPGAAVHHGAYDGEYSNAWDVYS